MSFFTEDIVLISQNKAFREKSVRKRIRILKERRVCYNEISTKTVVSRRERGDE